MKIALFLLTLGFGYKIYAEASSIGKKKMKALGRTIGIFMMIVSLIGTVCGIYFKASHGMGYCPYSGKSGWQCPYAKKSLPVAQR